MVATQTKASGSRQVRVADLWSRPQGDEILEADKPKATVINCSWKDSFIATRLGQPDARAAGLLRRHCRGGAAVKLAVICL